MLGTPSLDDILDFGEQAADTLVLCEVKEEIGRMLEAPRFDIRSPK